MPISYFILNKEDLITRNLNKLLAEFYEFSYDGCTDNYEKGMNLVLKMSPDVIFINIDVHYGSESVFSFCREINSYIQKEPLYVALSKDSSKAYLALKNQFYDYLLKPGRELEIRKTALRLLRDRQNFLAGTLCLKSYKDYTLLPIDEILYLKADNNATDFVLVNGKTVSAFKTLKSFESVLPDNFIRIHHSYIVNKNHISRINFGKSKCFLGKNRIRLPFSKTYRSNLYTMERLLEHKALLIS